MRSWYPRFGLFAAPKIVQGICYLIVLAAVWVLIRSKHGGLACGLLLGFCVFHTHFIADRIAGGLPRSFGFPLLVLWCAGAVGKSTRTRFLAVVLSSLTYPTTMLLMLSAEGFLVLRNFFGGAPPHRLKHVVRLAALVCLCLACFSLYTAGHRDVGRLPALEEARANPAFHEDGRLPLLPFPHVLSFAKAEFLNFFDAKAHGPFHRSLKLFGKLPKKKRIYINAAFAAALLLLFLLGKWRPPAPYPGIAVFLGAVCLYVLACAPRFSPVCTPTIH